MSELDANLQREDYLRRSAEAGRIEEEQLSESRAQEFIGKMTEIEATAGQEIGRVALYVPIETLVPAKNARWRAHDVGKTDFEYLGSGWLVKNRQRTYDIEGQLVVFEDGDTYDCHNPTNASRDNANGPKRRRTILHDDYRLTSSTTPENPTPNPLKIPFGNLFDISALTDVIRDHERQ